jgi:hypothetical protein
MGFLKRLFGGEGSSKGQSSDSEGFFFYVQCDNCDKKVRLRILRQYDLNYSDGSYVWHKRIVDSRCFQEIEAVVHFDGNYNVTNADINGGRQISHEEYSLGEDEAPEVSQPTDNDQGKE